MKIKVKIGLRDAADRPFMGIGPAWLLRGVEKAGSLNLAARDMGMSYSKAHKLVKTLEAALGYPVLASSIGGSSRGGSSLTPRGRKFLERYEKLDAAVKAQAEKLFEKTFPGGLVK
ncbi:MAG: LysR family transcriptional regulator [Elusimicrobiales bacterium]|nr:LysR family transcriptional regulator [Elusimicrobiales bacterium]